MNESREQSAGVHRMMPYALWDTTGRSRQAGLTGSPALVEQKPLNCREKQDAYYVLEILLALNRLKLAWKSLSDRLNTHLAVFDALLYTLHRHVREQGNRLTHGINALDTATSKRNNQTE
ncbi:MAG: hypothetical protein ABSB95_00320 [Dissulfurispiraceae bacterium]|jgi:hypothetical protein